MSKNFDSPAAFTRLSAAIDKDSYDEIITIADSILAHDAKDEDAHQCKIVALIKLGKFEAAVKAVHVSGLNSFLFETAYCYYRLKKFSQGLDALAKIPDSARDEGYFHLQAQLYYQSGEYAKSVSVYEAMKVDDVEAQSNLVAAYIGSGKCNSAISMKPAENTYEYMYNVSLALSEVGKWNEAMAELEKAQKLCDDEAELSMLECQSGFVKQMLGFSEDATKVYDKVISNPKADSTAVLVASNNSSVLHPKGFFETLKKQDKALTDTKLTVKQRKIAQLNHCILLVSKQGDKCLSEIESLEAEMPDNESPFLVHASLLLKEKKLEKATNLLSSFLAKHESVAARLAISHLFLVQNQIESAIPMLEKLNEVKELAYRPALVAVLVSLYTRVSNFAGALNVLDKAILLQSSGKNTSTKTTLQLQRLSLLKQLGKPLNLDSFEKDARSLSQLVSCLSTMDPALAMKYSLNLPMPKGYEEAKLLSLELLPAPVLVAKPKEKEKVVKLTKSNTTKLKKRKRKVIFPKGYDPSKPNFGLGPIDPERWLPKYQRSTYKPKGRKKKDLIGKGTQGGVQIEKKKVEEEKKEPVVTSSKKKSKK